LNDSLSATAYNLYTGERLWHFEGPLEALEDEDRFYALEDYFPRSDFSRRNIHAAATISPYMIAGVTVSGDAAFMNFQDRRPRREAKELDRSIINKAIPRRALFAVNLNDGRLLWAHGTGSTTGNDFLEEVSISSPPLVIGDRVLCSGYLREGGINTFLMSFDRDTGHMHWKVPAGIGQQELTMFNMEYKEFATTPLSEAGGMAIFCSNLGFVSAVDVFSGRVIWATEYETLELPQATHFTGSPNPRRVYWANNPPLVSGDLVIVSPLDSQYLMAYEWRTGTLRWKVHPRRLGTDLHPHLLGVHEDLVVLSGRSGALALSAEDGGFRWRVTLPPGNEVVGRGALTKDRLYLPLDGSVQVYELSQGKALNALDLSVCESPVNLFLLGEVVACAGPEQIALYFDASGMLNHALTRMQQGQGNSEDLAAIGDLYRLDMNLEQAISYYEQALKGTQTDPALQGPDRRRVEDCLFTALLEQGAALQTRSDYKGAEIVLRRAMDTALEPESVVRAGLALLTFFENTHQADRMEQVLDGLNRAYGDNRFDFSEYHEGLGEVPVGFFVLIKRLKLSETVCNVQGELAALQALLSRYPMEIFEGKEARPFAYLRIAELIGMHGREIYTAYDQEAEALYDEAIGEKGTARLLQIHERYPNALISGEVALEIAERYLEEGYSRLVYPILGVILQEDPHSEEWLYAYYLMARAAIQEGNHALAGYLKTRIIQTCNENPRHSDSEKSSLDLARSLDVSQAEEEAPLYLTQADPVVKKTRFSSNQCYLIKAGGVPPAFKQGKALIEFRTENQLALYDFERMERAWTQDVGRFQTNARGSNILLLFHLEEWLVAVFETKAVALSLKTGQFLWEYDPKGIVLDADMSAGLLCLITVSLDDEIFPNREGVSVVTMNPLCGDPLWSKTLEHSPKASFLKTEGSLCIAGLDQYKQPVILLPDPLTGRLNGEISFAAGEFSSLPFRSPQGMLLVLAHRPVTDNPGSRGKPPYHLEAYETSGGRLVWSVDLEQWLMQSSDCMLAGDRLMIFAKDRRKAGVFNTML
ncbi:MAG: PQQ-binding-like beta-propeller repeat protein, partial [Planctomycetes bacterium]|nr:PQQ-binding-like beta-propeller repeat protein [Planctomycetota bacterium]